VDNSFRVTALARTTHPPFPIFKCWFFEDRSFEIQDYLAIPLGVKGEFALKEKKRCHVSSLFIGIGD
jgi:hypothetical protein